VNDLTLIYLSANLISESTSKKILQYLPSQYPLIKIIQSVNYPNSVSSPYNYYKQILEGCYQSGTEFVATVEDDTLYPAEHFIHRPKGNYAYNTNAWLCGNKTYWQSPNMNSFGFYISRRLPLIELLENRFNHYPEPPSLFVQRHFHEPGVLEVDPFVKVETFHSNIPIIAFEHRGTLSGKRKRFGDPGIKTLKLFGDAKALYNQYWV
jgi:hypothetical protein